MAYREIPPSYEMETHPEILALPAFSEYNAVLINLPVDFQQGLISDGKEPPFGLGRIAVVAKEIYDLNVSIFDADRINKNGVQLSLADIKTQLLLIKAKATPGFVVGLNPTNVNLEAGIQVACLLDELGIEYVIGGYFATLSDASDVFRSFPRALGFIPRQGEVAFSALVACRVDGKSTANLPGFYTQNDENHPRAPYGHKITPKQTPAIDQHKYFYEPFTKTKIHDKLHTEASTYLTDGCPFECGFCSSPFMKERKYDRPSMQQILDEVERLVNQGADAIHFLDDLVFIKESDVIEFRQGLEKKGLLGKFVWRGMGRANLIDRWSNETMQALKDTGCWQIAIGVESGSARMLTFIRKQIDSEMVIRATEKNTSYGIGTKGFFIFGFPTETEAEMQETLDLAICMAKKGATSISAFEFHPYPGTVLYQWIKTNNPEVLKHLDYLTTNQTAAAQSNDLSPEAKANSSKTGMWLPEELCIAQVPSRIVRQYVQQTISAFHRIKAQREGNYV